MIVISAAWGTAFTLLRWIPCYPVRAYWDLSITDAHRWGFSDRNPIAFMNVFVSQAVSTAVLDSIIFAIPIPLCFKHDTPRKTRLCLVGLLILGSLYVLPALAYCSHPFVVIYLTNPVSPDPSSAPPSAWCT
jgi:hypothetical protein